MRYVHDKLCDLLRLSDVFRDLKASLYEPDFKKSFFGSHYDRLRSIKREYDPRSLFLVAEGVGSEDWNGSLTCPT